MQGGDAAGSEAVDSRLAHDHDALAAVGGHRIGTGRIELGPADPLGGEEVDQIARTIVGGTPETQLKYWLDPCGTDKKTLAGADPLCKEK